MPDRVELEGRDLTPDSRALTAVPRDTAAESARAAGGLAERALELQRAAGNHALSSILRSRAAQAPPLRGREGPRLMRHIDGKLVAEQMPASLTPPTGLGPPAPRVTPDDVRAWMGLMANAQQTVHEAVEEVLAKHPEICRELSLDVTWGNIRYWAGGEEISDQHQSLVRGYVAALPGDVNKVIRRALEAGPQEQKTRIGFEIELAMSFAVKPGYLDEAKQLVNQTLAETRPALLQFVIDDVDTERRTVQGEFRTAPLDIADLGPRTGADVKAAISHFPAGTQFGQDTLMTKLQTPWMRDKQQWQWHATPAAARILPGLTSKAGRPSLGGQAKLAQHVTHSIPLAGFVKLDPQDKELLIPGTGSVGTVVDLLMFFVRRKVHIDGDTIRVTTVGRNKLAPNPKSAIDTIIGLLDPAHYERAMQALAGLGGQLPGKVDVEGDVGAIQYPVTAATTVPTYPRFNPEGGRGFLSGEEKLKPVLVDLARRDFRILIEHRGSYNALITAVNDALAGRLQAIEPFKKLFQRLDKVEGDDVFSRWFH